jgi:hypothetical protein
MSLEQDLREVVAYGETEAQHVFAGTERGAEGSLLVGFTDNVDHHLGELAKRIRLPSRLRTFPAKWPLRHLQDVRARIDGDMSSYVFEREGFCVSSSYLEITDNAIVWEIFTADAEATNRFLQEHYGDVLKTVVLGRSPTLTHPVACSGYELVGPMALRLSYSAMTTSSLADVQLSESERRVEITVLINEYQGATPLEVRPAEAEVTLAAPLAQRGVFDTVSGKTLRRHREGGSPSTIASA